MKCKKLISVVFLSAYLLLISSTVLAQDTLDYYAEGFLRYDNFVYKNNIKTVVFEMENLKLSEPVLDLGKPDRLVLSFDDLDADFKNYSYTLIHCDANWIPSNLLQNEYLYGFSEDRIENYRSSFNTIQPYTRYWQEIPGREVKPIISGNYILKVFLEGEPNFPIITRRMLVLQPKANIEADVHQATIVKDRYSKQEIDFSVFYQGIQVTNPFEDIKVVILQNGRWDNSLKGLKPLFLRDNELEYSYDEENTFNGGNEYRTFDLRTVRVQTQFVKDIVQGPDGYTVVLTTGRSRSFDRYSIENDINGKFLIKNQDGFDDELGSEYVKVKFSLKHDILANGNFYVFGALTDWRLTTESKMVYNYDEEVYETLLYLKQGYYDYQYVFLEDGTDLPDETIIEGNHYETFNEYTILVYFRPLGGRYDQLIGLRRFGSR